MCNNNNRNQTPSPKKNRQKTSSICKNFSKAAGSSWDDSSSSSQVVIMDVRLLQNDLATPPSFPQANYQFKSSTLPRLTASPNGSPRKINLSPEVNNSPSHSRTPTPSPSPSPKLGKRSIGPVVPQRPGAVDNTLLIIPNSQKVTTRQT